MKFGPTPLNEGRVDLKRLAQLQCQSLSEATTASGMKLCCVSLEKNDNFINLRSCDSMVENVFGKIASSETRRRVKRVIYFLMDTYQLHH